MICLPLSGRSLPTPPWQMFMVASRKAGFIDKSMKLKGIIGLWHMQCTVSGMTAINFENALGIHADYLEFRTARARVLASNIANADTPGYRARELTFASNANRTTPFSQVLHGQLKLAETETGESVTTNQRHLPIRFPVDGVDGFDERFLSSYRSEFQLEGLDGNTVDIHEESAAFARNALDFSVSFRLLNSKFSGLSKAITGE